MFQQKAIFPNKFWHCILLLILSGLIMAMPIAISFAMNLPINIYSAELFPGFIFCVFVIIYYFLLRKKDKLANMQSGGWKNFKVSTAIYVTLAVLVFSYGVVLLFREYVKQEYAVPMWWYIVLTSLFYGVSEEMLFRGIFMNNLLVRYNNPYLVIILLSVLFGLCHYDSLFHIILSFSYSCLFGYVYLKTKNLIYCILMHTVGDIIIGSPSLFFDWSKPLSISLGILFVASSSIILLCYLKKKY